LPDKDKIINEKSQSPAKTKNSFANDVIKLALGTTFAQGLTILAAPLLTRLYSPEAFGVFALMSSIISIIGVIACMRYELSIMLPDSDEKAVNLLIASLGFAVVVSLLTTIIMGFGRGILTQWLGIPELSFYFWLIPIAVIETGFFVSLSQWNIRTKRFGFLSITRFIRSITTTSAKLGSGYIGYTNGQAMFSSNIIGSVLSTLYLGWQVLRNDGKLIRYNTKWHDIIQGIKQYRKFPLYSTWAALLNSVSWQLPVFFLSSAFSSTIVGYYTLGDRVLRLPMLFIGAAIGDVFFQRASEAKFNGTLDKVVENTFRSLTILGVFPMLLITIIGRDLFVIAFGRDWAEAGVYAQIMSIWTLLCFISSPLSTLLFSVLEKQELSLFWNISNFVIKFLSLWIGGSLLKSPRLTLIFLASSGTIIYGYLVVKSFTCSDINPLKIVKIFFSSFILFIPTGIILLILKLLDAGSWIIVGTSFILLVCYMGFVFKRNPQIQTLIKQKSGKDDQ
jgi:O-antigen/teichoic acid export membrane protein